MARCSVVCENGQLLLLPDINEVSECDKDENLVLGNEDDSDDIDCETSKPGLEIVPIDLSSDDSSTEVLASIKKEPEDDPKSIDVPAIDNQSACVAAQNGFGIVCPSLASKEKEIVLFPTNPHCYKMCPEVQFEGKHNFKVEFPTSKNLKNLKELLYCPKQNKLYVSKDQVFEVFVKADDVPSGSFVRVHAAYSEPRFWSTPVRRCPAHQQMDLKTGFVLYEHFILSLTEHAIYKKDGDVLSVSVPYVKPSFGAEYSCYLFKFACFTSCFGGIDRKPISVIFSLEKDQDLLGRQPLHAKVCANPARDYQADIRKFLPEYSIHKQDSEDMNGFKENINEVYSIKVRDFELYTFLKNMKDLYESGALVQQIKKINKNG